MTVQDLHVREATEGDLEDLANLEVACFPEPWSAAALGAELRRTDGEFLLAAAPGTMGYACFLVVAGEAELLRLAVLPCARRRGLGRLLLGQGLARLERRGVTLCHLEVAEENQGAIALYESLGFTLCGRRSGYYRHGGDALLFKLDPLSGAVLC